ncbi:MAG: DUF1571 domain-containing protein [Isosphaeraceae bacterium]
MKMATDSARLWMYPRRIVMIPLALVFWCLAGGCAGLSSLDQRASSLSSLFWNHSAKTAEVPGYDEYAAGAMASHPNIEQELAQARRESRPQANDPLQNPSRTELLAHAEEAESKDKPRSRSRSRLPGEARKRTVDSSIRVTLGKPESLQTIADEPSAKAPVLASAPVTNWKRSGTGNSSLPDEYDEGRVTTPRRRPPAPPQARRDESFTRSTETLVARAQDSLPKRQSKRETKPASSNEKLRAILLAARNRLDAVTSYQVTMTRAERVGGRLQSEDDVLLSIRRKPKAVRLEWTNGPSKGREVIYSSAINDRMMYVNMANSSLPVPRMSLPIDSPLALRNSRHPISEAGFDTILDNLMKHLRPDTVDARRDGKLSYKGVKQPSGVDEPCHLFERITPSGETWQVYLQTRTLLPVVVSAVKTSSGELIERYSYRDLKLNPTELASAEAFDPDKRWGESKGWLSRLARAAGGPAGAGSGASTTR